MKYHLGYEQVCWNTYKSPYLFCNSILTVVDVNDGGKKPIIYIIVKGGNIYIYKGKIERREGEKIRRSEEEGVRRREKDGRRRSETK